MFDIGEDNRRATLRDIFPVLGDRLEDICHDIADLYGRIWED